MPSSGVQTCALRSEEHTSELQSHDNLACRLLLEKKTRHMVLTATSVPGLVETRTQVAADEALGVRDMHVWLCFFFNDTATTEIYTLSLHDALPISQPDRPTRMNATLNRADCAAIRTSLAIASARPPPDAAPLTAAITGCGTERMRGTRPAINFCTVMPAWTRPMSAEVGGLAPSVRSSP